ncbi:MAG TPA: carbohydrate ABC transporter permease [Aestuariivirgaceae bacterium]|jgi:ABC-type glycerol-3-phosphate transport system permease component
MTLEAEHRGVLPSEPLVAARPQRNWFNQNRPDIIRHAVINLFMIIILLPLAWVFMMSIKSRPDSMRGEFWPRKFDFTHYSYVFEKIDTLPINLLNSIYVTTGTVLLTTFCAVLAGYALVHLRPRGGGIIVAMLLISLYFPTRVVSIISIYEIQDYLDLINSTSGLILPYVTLNLAISVLIMRSVFQLVPHELIEAAKVDGAGPWRTLWMVGLPMVRNGLVVVFIVNFVTAWGEFLLCTTLTNDQVVRTMPVVLAGAQGGLGQWSWPALAAVYVLVVTPGLVAFTFAQKLFFKGLMEGVVKG